MDVGGDMMSVINTLKSVTNLVKDIGNIELNQKIIELQTELLELIEENHQVKSEIREMKENEDMEARLKFKDNMYYFKDDLEEKEPFCSACWDNDNKLIRIHTGMYGLQNCPVCLKEKTKRL